MVFFKNQRRLQTSCPSYSNALLLDLMSEKLTEQHNVIQLVSSGESAYVHTALLRNVSVFLCDILSSSCLCETNVLILPASPPSTLENLVTMLYTGHNSTGLSRDQARHVIEIAKGLDLDITIEVIDSDINNYDNIDADQDSSLIFCTDSDADREEQNDQALRIKTTIVNKHGSLTLSFPESRSSRQASHMEINENMVGFHGRVQKEYNAHPVGKYMGPYDQNKKLELKIQLPDSNLDFRKYTEQDLNASVKSLDFDLGLEDSDLRTPT